MHGAYCTYIRHRHRGGMLNKTPPPTELQIPATITTLEITITIINMGRKFGGLGTHLKQSPLGWGLPPYRVASWCIQPFGYNRNGPRIGEGGSAPFLGRGAGSPCNTKFPGLRPTSIPSGMLIQPAIWRQQTWAENWGLCPFGGRGRGSPSNTMWSRPRPTGIPSFILIHTTVWPQ